MRVAVGIREEHRFAGVHGAHARPVHVGEVCLADGNQLFAGIKRAVEAVSCEVAHDDLILAVAADVGIGHFYPVESAGTVHFRLAGVGGVACNGVNVGADQVVSNRRFHSCDGLHIARCVQQRQCVVAIDGPCVVAQRTRRPGGGEQGVILARLQAQTHLLYGGVAGQAEVGGVEGRVVQACVRSVGSVEDIAARVAEVVVAFKDSTCAVHHRIGQRSRSIVEGHLRQQYEGINRTVGDVGVGFEASQIVTAGSGGLQVGRQPAQGIVGGKGRVGRSQSAGEELYVAVERQFVHIIRAVNGYGERRINGHICRAVAEVVHHREGSRAGDRERTYLYHVGRVNAAAGDHAIGDVPAGTVARVGSTYRHVEVEHIVSRVGRAAVVAGYIGGCHRKAALI